MAGATHDDGSCAVLGCMDPYAPNHDAAATLDDGSCVAVIRGCMVEDADNYDPSALAPRGSAPYEAFAGLPPFAPDGCLYVGCMQPSAANYDSRAAYESGWCVNAPPGSPPPPRATTDGTVAQHTLLSHRQHPSLMSPLDLPCISPAHAALAQARLRPTPRPNPNLTPEP